MRLEDDLFQPHNNYYVATSDDAACYDRLEGDIETETLIIGGGLAGVATGLGLIERGHKEVTLIESQTIGYGASGRNGGFVFGGYSLPEKQLLAKLGPLDGRWAYQLTTAAVELIRDRVHRYNIDCDLIESGIVLADWFKDPASLRAKQQYMKTHLDIDWEWLGQHELNQHVRSKRYYNGLYERNAFHIHPLKYIKSLSKVFASLGGACYEQTKAVNIVASREGVTVKTETGLIRARRCVLACGGYMEAFYPPVARSMLPISTYVAVTNPLGPQLESLLPQQSAIYDTRFAFDYYRPLSDSRLLWGGRISTKALKSASVKRILLGDVKKVFPELDRLEFEYAWSGLMGYPIHKMPMIGRTDPSIWHVTGFGGHGVAPTTAGGELIAAAILGDEDKVEKWAKFPPKFAGGVFGLGGAQLTYWAYQTLDWIRSQRDRFY